MNTRPVAVPHRPAQVVTRPANRHCGRHFGSQLRLTDALLGSHRNAHLGPGRNNKVSKLTLIHICIHEFMI